MCVVSTVIDGWQHPTWPYQPISSPFIPAPHTQPVLPGPNAIPWPQIQADPKLAEQMLDVLARLEKLDKRLGAMEQCKISQKAKQKLKRDLRKVAKRGSKANRKGDEK